MFIKTPYKDVPKNFPLYSRYPLNICASIIKYIQNLDEESFKDIRISLQNGKITTLSEEDSILS